MTNHAYVRYSPADQLQIQEGDHHPQKHTSGWFGGPEQLQRFVPPEVLFKFSVDYIEERIFRLHAKMVGKNNNVLNPIPSFIRKADRSSP